MHGSAERETDLVGNASCAGLVRPSHGGAWAARRKVDSYQQCYNHCWIVRPPWISSYSRHTACHQWQHCIDISLTKYLPPQHEQVTRHLDQFVGQEQEALLFMGARGGIWRRSNFRRHTRWYEAVEKIGAPGLHFHDLRHTGNHLAASSGASLRDLMQRMGHDSVRAAMIYQHSTAEADRHIADVINSKIEAARQAKADPGGGPAEGAASTG